jgi:hypothetical protein
MIISVLIASAVIGLLLVLLVQGKWTSLDSWFVAVLASSVMAMVISQYVDHLGAPAQTFLNFRRLQGREVAHLNLYRGSAEVDVAAVAQFKVHHVLHDPVKPLLCRDVR